MQLKLYCNSKEQPTTDSRNEGFDEVMNLLQLLQKQSISSETVDTSSLSDEEIQRAYLEAVTPSVYKKFRIRQIFGSRRRSGWLFGKEVPALFVYEEGERYPINVYPHTEQGRVRTIKEFLENLLNKVAQ